MRSFPILLTALLVAAVVLATGCGGDDDDGGDISGGQKLQVQGLLRIELLEDFVSAGPLGQATTTFSGEGTGSATLAFNQSGTIQFGDMTINFNLSSEDGQTINVTATADPDQSTGTTEPLSGGDDEGGAQGWTMGVVFDFDMNADRPMLTNADPLELMGGAELTTDGEVLHGSVSSDPESTPDLVDEEDKVQGQVSSVALSFGSETTLSDPGTANGQQNGSSLPQPVTVPDGFEYMLLFGASGASFNVTTTEDGPGGHLYGDPSFEPGFAQGENDIISATIARLQIEQDSAEILDSMYPCPTAERGAPLDDLPIRVACNNPSLGFPSGEVFMVSTELGAGPPLPGDPILADRACTYANAFNNDGGQNFGAAPPFSEDFYQRTYYWAETVGGLSADYVEQFSTAIPLREPVPDGNVRQVLMPELNRVFTFTPVDAVPTATGVRITADCHLPDFNPSGSGGDIVGELPSSASLQLLPGSERVMTIDILTLAEEQASGVGDAGEKRLLGDVNCDGVVNSTDAIVILALERGLETPPDICKDLGDVNDDGLVNSTDALIILSFDAGMEVPFPVGEAQ